MHAAAHNLLKKISFFLATALLIAVPARTQSLIVSSNTVALNTNQAQSIQVTASDGSAMRYSASAAPFWLSMSSTNNFTTADTLSFQVLNSNCVFQSGGCSTTITLTPANGTAAQPISVTYAPSTGGGNGTILANPASLTFNALSGQTAATQVVGLSTTSVNPISFQVVPDQNWLAFSVTNFTISSASPQSLTVQASAFTLTNGIYTGHLTLTPNAGTASTVTVTLNVGTTGSSTLTVSQNSFQFAAPNGTQSGTVSVSSTSISQFNFQTSSQGNWLLFDFTTAGSAFVGNSHVVSVNSNAVGSLATGTYQGTVTLSNPNNAADNTVINVTLSVNGGTGGGTFNVNPTSLTFTAVPGGASQSENLIITAPNNSAVQVNISSNNGSFFTVTSPSCNGTPTTTFSCSFVGNQTLVFTVNTPGLTVAGPYTASIQITSGSSSASVPLTLNLQSSVTALTVTPSALNFAAAAGGISQSQNLNISVPAANPFVQATITQSSLGNFFTVSSPCTGVSVCTFNGSQPLTVTVNPANLTTAGTYSGSIQFQSGGVLVNVPVTLTLSGSGVGNTSGIASPTSLSFAYQTGRDPNLPAQAIIVAASGTFTVSTSVGISQQWLVAAAANNNGPNRVTVSVSPQGLAAGTYQGSITINTASSGSQLINVALLVTAGTVLEVNPGTFNFFYQAGTGPLSPEFQLSSSDGSTFNATLSTTTSWISIPVSSVSGAAVPFSIQLNPSVLCNGLNAGSFTITAAGDFNSPITVPVVLMVSGSTVTTGCTSGGTGPLTLNPSALTFNAQVNGASPNIQTIGVTVSATSSFYNVSASVQSGGTNWLLVSPSGNLSGSQNVNVSVNQSGLPVGTYSGSVVFNSNSVIQTVPVTLVVSTTGTGNLNVSATTLNFSFQPGGTTPAGQTLSITSATGANTAFSYSVSSTGNFLSATSNGATVANGQILSTPATLTVNANPSGLTAGQTYTGAITLTPSGGSPVTITVNLTISNASVLSVTPASLTFNYNAGDPAPSTQNVQVSGAQGLTFTAAASSTGNWLSVSPASGTIGASPANLSVSVNPTGLNAGSYTGTITVTGTGTATGTSSVTVTLTVNAPRPTITSVASAASYVGNTISPGEIITIFGTSIGPTPGVTLALDPATGKVATTLGGVQVVINGFLAPMVFASNTQVSAVVPYEVAGGPGTIANVIVKFLGQSSNGIGVSVAATAPGIFTLNASGSGPGAILNANLSGNSPGNPANKGDTVAIYMTGEGLTSPTGVTGKVTTVSSTGPLTPVPLLPVAVLIDGTPSAISFAGEAPGLVSGVLQVNVQIPPGARSGPLSLVVSIGGVSSQAGVTVSVR